MELKTKNLINKKLGDLIRDGFLLFTKNYTKLILPFAALSILGILVRVFFLADLEWIVFTLNARLDEIIRSGTSNNPYEFVMVFYRSIIAEYLLAILKGAIYFIFILIAMCLTGRYLLKSYANREVDFKNEIKRALNSKILIPIFLVGFGFAFGLLFFLIPAFIILGYYSFTIYTYNMDLEQSTVPAARSIEKGAFWRIIGIYVLSHLMILILGIFLYTLTMFLWNPRLDVWLNPATRNYFMLFIHELITNLHIVILSPLYVCLLTPLFASQQSKKEQGISETAPPKTKIEKGIFCPYCGDYMDRVKKFCPNCGEKLDIIKT